MEPTLNQVVRLLEAAEAMSSLLTDHTDELARGEDPLVFTALDVYVELQEAATDLRQTLTASPAATATPESDIPY